MSGRRSFRHARLRVGAVHGTGCALASAIAAGLARDVGVEIACERSIAWLQRCLSELLPAAGGDALPRPLPIVVG